MNIVVLLKQTPDTESVIKISDDGKSIPTDGFKWIINPYDEFAVEAALRLKEKLGGTVTIVSAGPQRATEAIRTALAMGADRGLLIDDDALEGSDNLGYAKALAAAARSVSPDLILCGSRSVDYDLGQRGPMVAELLARPHLAMAVAISADAGKVSIERAVEGGRVFLEAELPAVVTLGGSHTVWTPRYPTLPNIMKARKKPLEVKKLADIGLDASEFGPATAKMRMTVFEMPPQRAPGRIVGADLDTAGKAAELVRLLHEEARVI